ncbi:hypothetical protein ACWDV4_05310 [Micromonospora sp. NPDC003197]
MDQVKPGETIDRRVEVTNSSTADRDIELYPAAASVAPAGFTFAPDRTRNELTDWIRLEHDTLALEAGRHARTWVAIDVPKLAPSANVRNVGRVGIRICLSIGPGGEPASDFEIDQFTGERTPDGTPVVTARVRNTGARALDLGGTLSLSDGPDRLSAGSVDVKLDTLGIGATTTLRVPLDPRIPDGRWTARLSLVSGQTEHTATGTVTFGDPTVRQAAFRPFSLLAGTATVAVLAVALFGGYTYQRHRSRVAKHRR